MDPHLYTLLKLASLCTLVVGGESVGLSEFGALDVRQSLIEFVLVPLAFLPLLVPLEARGCGLLRVVLRLVREQASELLNREVLAGVVGVRLMNRVGEFGDLGSHVYRLVFPMIVLEDAKMLLDHLLPAGAVVVNGGMGRWWRGRLGASPKISQTAFLESLVLLLSFGQRHSLEDLLPPLLAEPHRFGTKLCLGCHYHLDRAYIEKKVKKNPSMAKEKTIVN
jgi:hypothetical protein